MPFDFNTQTNKNYLQTINPNAPDAGAALKVLSLNLPNFLGGSPIAPDGLLRPGLSTNAQVGGTPSAPPSAPAPAPSDAMAGLLAQLGSPTPAPDAGGSGGAPLASASAPSSPTAASPAGASPFAATAAPIASLASSAIGDTSSGAPTENNFAPPQTPQGPIFTFTPPDAPRDNTALPTGGGLGGGTVPNNTDALSQLLTTLFSAFSEPDNIDTQRPSI